MKAIDGFGKDTCTRGFSYSARTAEQVGMSKLAGCNGFFQCSCKRFLPYNGIKG